MTVKTSAVHLEECNPKLGVTQGVVSVEVTITFMLMIDSKSFQRRLMVQ